MAGTVVPETDLVEVGEVACVGRAEKLADYIVVEVRAFYKVYVWS
jgi:hypothetical protein